MRILICDDEQRTAESIAAQVRAHLTHKAVDSTIDVCTDSSRFASQSPVYDLAVLDIRMEPIDGIRLAKILKEANERICIFIVTAHSQYLDDAMDLQVYRYLQKPVQMPRLLQGIDRALERMHSASIECWLRDGKRQVRMLSDEIQYIEVCGRKTNVYTAQGTYVSDNSIRRWQEVLPAAQFFRTHGSFIVNLRRVTEYNASDVTIDGKMTVPLATRAQGAFRRQMMCYYGG